MSDLAGLCILQVLPALQTGGVERGTIEIAEALAADGARPLVASAGGRMVPLLERVGARHAVLPLMTKDPVNLLLNAGRLGRLTRREGVALVHARSRAPAWSARLAARRAGLPFVTTWHGIYGEGLPGKRLYNSVMASGDRVIAISHYVADLVEHRYGVPRARIRVIPRGVDPAMFDPATVGGDRVHRLAEAWRLPPGTTAIVLPGRLTAWKGAELLLDALAQTGRRDVALVLAGDAQGRTRFERALVARAARLGLASALRIAGHCEDMPAVLALADLVVAPSTKPEAFGRAVIEAQAMARPVIAADHGGAAETIVEGETGWRVPPRDARALAARIVSVLDMDPELRAEIGARARASVAAHYTKQAMQAATLDLYRELVL